MKNKYIKNLIFILVIMLSFLITSCTLKDYSNNLNTDDNIKNEEAENESSGKVQALINLYIRSEPTIDSSNILGILDKYDTIDFIKRYDNEWYVVNFKGITAYISAKIKNSKILTIEENTDNNLTSSDNENITNNKDNNTQQEQLNNEQLSDIEAVIKAGESVLGTPYLYGSERILINGVLNPDFSGENFDCSAFVQYAFYKGAGIKLQGDSRSMSTEGQDVSFDNLQRGDIIFMTSTSRMNNTGIERIGHVAIYLGNNKIMHTYGDPGVVIQDFSSFWQSRFIKAKRMI